MKALPYILRSPHWELFLQFSPSNFAAGKVVPLLHVRQTLFVAADNHFTALLDALAILTARSDTPPNAMLLENHFARSIRRNPDADFSYRPFMPIIPFVHLRSFALQQLEHEPVHHPRSKSPCNNCQRQNRDYHQI